MHWVGSDVNQMTKQQICSLQGEITATGGKQQANHSEQEECKSNQYHLTGSIDSLAQEIHNATHKLTRMSYGSHVL